MRVPEPFVDLDVNFMTPHIMEYVELRDDNWAELSRGESLDGGYIYGVTVRPDGSLGEMFHDLGEARTYIHGLLETVEEAEAENWCVDHCWGNDDGTTSHHPDCEAGFEEWNERVTRNAGVWPGHELES